MSFVGENRPNPPPNLKRSCTGFALKRKKKKTKYTVGGIIVQNRGETPSGKVPRV